MSAFRCEMCKRQLTYDENELWCRVISTTTPIISKLNKPIENKLPCIKQRDHYHPVLDLHGVSLQNAFKNVESHIEAGLLNNMKFITIITGKSGDIYTEFPEWIRSLSEQIQSVNKGGSWILKYKQKR